MYARSTTIDGDPGALEAGINHIRNEVLPAVSAMEGSLGMSLVVDRESGRGIATASWETEEALLASRERVMAFRTRASEILGGGTPVVEEWEVAVMHRDHTSPEGSCCRITWARARDVDPMVDLWRTRLLPRIENLAGFCSASMLVDRAGGRLCGTVTFDSRAALEASRGAAAAIRETAVTEMGAEILDVAEFDLAIAHLRLPELV